MHVSAHIFFCCIDIEQIRPIDLTVAKRICTEEELLYLFDRIPTEQDFTYATDTKILTRFFELWTAKEAYGKCIGKGIYNLQVYRRKALAQKFSIDNYLIAIYTY